MNLEENQHRKSFQKTCNAFRKSKEGSQNCERTCIFRNPVGDEEDSSLGDFIEDKNALQPLDTAIQSNLSSPQQKF